jgi:hypothetical protein
MSCGAALAAGGHHGVDDAELIDAGHCEAESWLTRSADSRRLLHAGAACRIGPIEVGASGEYARIGGSERTGWGLDAKFAREIAPGWSAGFSWSAGWEAHETPHFQGETIAALVTWRPRDGVVFHANLGRDFLRNAANQARSGAAVEWDIGKAVPMSVERYLEDRAHFMRVGWRWAASDAWAFEVSHARSLRGPHESNWTLGLTRVVQR